MNEKAEVRWGLGDALLGLLLSVLIPGMVGAVVFAASNTEPGEDIAIWTSALLQIPLWVALLGVPWWASQRKGRSSLAADFGLHMQWRDVPVGLGVGFLAQVVLGLALNTIYQLLGVDTEEIGRTAKDLADQVSGTLDVVVLVLVVVVAAPIFEELFYRGLWLRALENRWGTRWAIILSSLLFGAIHFQPYDFPVLSTIGLFTSLLTVKFGRLGPAIWLHVSFNLTAVINLL